MDLVEKAAQRLAQLQKAGVEVPVPQVPVVPAPGDGGESMPTPERLAQALERAQPAEPRVAVPAAARAVTPASHGHELRAGLQVGPRSKVVQIDLDALAAAGFVTPQAQRSQIADEFRVIKRPIIRNAHEPSRSTATRC